MRSLLLQDAGALELSVPGVAVGLHGTLPCARVRTREVAPEPPLVEQGVDRLVTELTHRVEHSGVEAEDAPRQPVELHRVDHVDLDAAERDAEQHSAQQVRQLVHLVGVEAADVDVLGTTRNPGLLPSLECVGRREPGIQVFAEEREAVHGQASAGHGAAARHVERREDATAAELLAGDGVDLRDREAECGAELQGHVGVLAEQRIAREAHGVAGEDGRVAHRPCQRSHTLGELQIRRRDLGRGLLQRRREVVKHHNRPTIVAVEVVEPGSREGAGVAADDRVGMQHGADRHEDLVLEVEPFCGGLDDPAEAGDGGGGDAGLVLHELDPLQRIITLLRRGPTLADQAVPMGQHLSLSLLQRLHVGVQQDDAEARTGCLVGQPCAHGACADHGQAPILNSCCHGILGVNAQRNLSRQSQKTLLEALTKGK